MSYLRSADLEIEQKNIVIYRGAHDGNRRLAEVSVRNYVLLPYSSIKELTGDPMNPLRLPHFRTMYD